MQFAKHIHVLHLVSNIPSFCGVKNNGGYTSEQIADGWDHLFGYIHENFPEPESVMLGRITHPVFDTQGKKNEAMNCREMLDGLHNEDFMAKFLSLPPYFTDVVFPAAVAKHLLRYLHYPLDHRKSKTFREFHRRYGGMILA